MLTFIYFHSGVQVLNILAKIRISYSIQDAADTNTMHSQRIKNWTYQMFAV